MVGFGSNSTSLGLLVCTYHDFFTLSSRRLPLQSKRTIIAFDGRPFGMLLDTTTSNITVGEIDYVGGFGFRVGDLCRCQSIGDR